jgi:hypothetical protein
MLTSPSSQQLMALVAIVQQGYWIKVDEMIEAEIKATVDRMLENSDPAVLHECRGRAKALREFQSTAREASAILEKQGLRAPL